MEQASRSESGVASNAFAAIKAPARNFDSTRNDGGSVGFELVGTPAILGFVGYLVDRALGTGPVVAMTFALVSFATVVGLVLWRYNNEMADRDAERRAAQQQRGFRPARWERTTTADLHADAPTHAAATGETVG